MQKNYKVLRNQYKNLELKQAHQFKECLKLKVYMKVIIGMS